MTDASGRTGSPSSGASEVAIEIENLVVEYGWWRKKQAVDGLTMSVPVGSVYGFLGPNGAGKTTTIKTLLGFRRPDGGRASVFGCDVSRESVEARSKVGFASEVSSLYEGMTVRQNAALCENLSRSWNRELVRRYYDLFSLDENTKARKLSKGQKAQLQLCLALGSEPEIVILDEPTSGLDPVARRAFLKVLVGEVAASGKTVFFSTHLLSDIEAAADSVGIIRNGRLLVSGEIDDLREMHHVFRVAYREIPPDEEIKSLGRLPGVTGVEREGRGVRVMARGSVESVESVLKDRPYEVRNVDGHGLGLEDIFLGYIEDRERGDDC